MEPEVRAVMEMYRDAETAVQIEDKGTELEVKVGASGFCVATSLLLSWML